MIDVFQKPKVLAGIRVVDFCHGGVGPLSTMFLGDAGAQVIRVETGTRVEVGRRAIPFKEGKFDTERSAHYAGYNLNKLGITLNLKHPKAIDLAKRLIATADIVTDAFTPGVMPRLGLGYEELKKVKPDIIQISMSFAGRSGPYSHQRGHGPILAALVGSPGLVGWEESPPIAPGLAYTDYSLPQAWELAVISALIYRDETGEGQFIDASDFEGAIDILDTALLEQAVNGRQRRRLGNRHEWAVPHGCYPCAGEDRWCMIGVFDDQEWRQLCLAIGKPALAADERFVTFATRRENEDELDEIIGAWTSSRDAYEVMRTLQAAGIPAGVTQNAADLWQDPQLQHRHHFWEAPDDPDGPWYTYETQGFLMSETPVRIERRAPHLGEHNEHVFGELMGLTKVEIAALIAEGAIQ